MKDYRRLAVALSVVVVAGCASTAPAPVVERGNGSAAAGVAARDLYTIKSGDTLYSIARDHGIDYRDLIAWNSIETPNRIRAGQQLRVRPPGAIVAPADTVITQPIGGGTSGVEQRPLDGGTVAAPSSSSMLKTEPKAGKLPYSEEALAQAQRSSEPAAMVAARTEVKPEPKPEAKAQPGGEPVAAGPDDLAWIWPSSGKLIGQFSESGSKGIDIAGKAGDPVIAAGEGKVVYSGTGLRGYGKLIIVKHNATFLSAYAHNQNLLVKEGQSVNKGQKIAEMGNSDSDQVKLHFEIRRQGKPVDPLRYLPQR
ncbi:MAG: peptidoglycan DD-metalloendopeptidase family protein [Rhodocyclales bacterium]|nr:peptidoglycan DD-metalloendopeptidase family protein [Rhodocyclales bacterium]